MKDKRILRNIDNYKYLPVFNRILKDYYIDLKSVFPTLFFNFTTPSKLIMDVAKMCIKIYETRHRKKN